MAGQSPHLSLLLLQRNACPGSFHHNWELAEQAFRTILNTANTFFQRVILCVVIAHAMSPRFVACERTTPRKGCRVVFIYMLFN